MFFQCLHIGHANHITKGVLKVLLREWMLGLKQSRYAAGLNRATRIRNFLRIHQPFIGQALFGAKFTMSGPALAALTAGVCLVVIALTLAQAMIALRRYAVTAFSWIAGVAAFIAWMSFGVSDIFTRAEIGFVVGGLVAALWMAIAVRRAVSEVHA